MSVTCSGCGAILSDDAVVCDLCGTPVEGAPELQEIAPDRAASEEPVVEENAEFEVGDSDAEGVFCNKCGWKNPVGARFCSRCGHALQDVGGQASAGPSGPGRAKAAKSAGKPPGTSGTGGKQSAAGGKSSGSTKASLPSKEVAADQPSGSAGGLEPGAGKRMGILVGASVLVVVALFMVFNMNKGGTTATPTTSTSIQAPVEAPLEGEFADREAQLQSELAGLTGEARIDKERELLTLYFTSGRFDLAGAQAEVIGEATNAESAWIDAGNFYYDWMESSPSENKAYYSRKATSAYQRALEINPDNLDTRTDMAVAYLYDPDNSMLAIQETQKVLAADSNHVQANFNRGIMLWQINRVDEAVAQFEKVLRLVDDPSEPIYQRASEALTSLRQGGAGS
jgi:ribosomal protein L40E